MDRGHALAGLVVAVLVAIAGATGCEGAKGGAGGCPCDSAEQTPPVDAALMAYLSKARAIHHEADLLEEDGRVAEAEEKLTALVTAPAPGGGVMPEVREVLADAHARAAELRGRLGRFDDAEKSVQEGLKHAPAGSYFEGHLHEVRGVVEQRRSEVLARAGDAAAARKARDAAMRSFERAVEIQDAVVDRALGGEGGADGG